MAPRIWISAPSTLRFSGQSASKTHLSSLRPSRERFGAPVHEQRPVIATNLGMNPSFLRTCMPQRLLFRPYSGIASASYFKKQSYSTLRLSRQSKSCQSGSAFTVNPSTLQPLGKGCGVRWLATGRSDNEKADGPERPRKVTLKAKLLTRLTPHENIYTLPNILTFSRLVAAPFVGYFIATSQHTLALSLFFYAGVTDLIDGYIARRFQMQTVVGTVIDPMADKALMTISVVALAMRHGIPWWLASLILLRDVGLGVAAIYYRWISLPPPKTMARYWDFSLPSAEVKPTQISKYNTFLQLLLVGAGLALPVIPTAILHEYSLNMAFQGFQYLVALTTVWSGASYVYSKDAVKILTQEEVEERLAQKKKELDQH